MKKLLAAFLGVVALAVLISCGGSGTKPLSVNAHRILNIQKFSFLSMSNAGLGYVGFGFGGGGGTTGGGGGGASGGSGVSSIGGFIRHLGGPNGLAAFAARKPLEIGTTGGTGGGGGTGGEWFYYDEWLQLWVDAQWSENNYSSHFYADEAKSQPAGHMNSVFSGSWDVFPQTYTSDYAFTAGSLSGAHGTYISTQTSESEGSMTYDDTYVDGSHDHGASSWTAAGSSWTSRWDGANDQGWYEDSGNWSADGSGAYSCATSAGWATTWHYNADWSGSAHFEGPDPLLPADMTWTAEGRYSIRWADGTTETWSWEDLWSEGGETGTTGSGGGIVVGPGMQKKG
jgi:hypothetical protein